MDKAGIIKEQVSVEQVLQQHGVELRFGRIKCFAHNGEHYNVDTKNGFVYCHVCKWKGTVIDITMHFENCDAKRAIEILGARYNLWSDTKLTAKERQEFAIKQQSRQFIKAIRNERKRQAEEIKRYKRDKILERLWEVEYEIRWFENFLSKITKEMYEQMDDKAQDAFWDLVKMKLEHQQELDELNIQDMRLCGQDDWADYYEYYGFKKAM